MPYLSQSQTRRLHLLITGDDAGTLTSAERREMNALKDQWQEAEDRAAHYAAQSECACLCGEVENVRDVVGGL